MIYKIEEPEFIGKMPIKQELTVMSGDTPKKPIGWMCNMYSGSEVFLVDDDNQPIKTPLMKKADLQHGTKVCVTTLVGDYLMTINVEDDEPFAVSDSKNMLAWLEFDKDDRHCWTSSGSVNLRGIKNMYKETDGIK